MNEPAPPKKRWGCLIWTVVIIVTLLLASNFLPTYGLITVKANQLKGIQYVREITIRLHVWASEHEGYYPDHGKDLTSLTSNEVFRELIRHDPTMNESIFGCPGSRFMPDKHIGVAPDYDQALIAGENHWAMSAGLRLTKSRVRLPLIFENPVDATWPPRWRADSIGKPLPGRANYGGKVIVGFNDGGAELVELQQIGDRMHLPLHIYALHKKSPLPILKVLNIIVSGTGSYTDLGAFPPAPSGLPPLPIPPPNLDAQKSTDPQ